MTMNKTLFFAASALLTILEWSAASPLSTGILPALNIYQTIPYPIAFVAFTATQRTAPSGLVGENEPNWLSVEYQRGVMEPMTFGVINNQPAIIANEWLAIDKAFTYQRPDGGFIYAPTIAGVVQPPTQEPSNDAFFLAETVTPFLLLSQNQVTAPTFLARLQAQLPALARALKFLEQPSSICAMEQNDTKATNRLTIDAKALLLNGLLLQDSNALTEGQFLVAQVLGAQNSDGVFPENGGYDSSYQAVSLLKLCELYVFDPESGVLSGLKQGFAWEGTRILPTGQISTAGNSRIGAGETYFGTVKTVNYPEAIRAFALFGAITGDNSYTATSLLISKYYSANQN